MLPGDKKPWAKPVAATVVILSFVAAIIAVFYLNDIQMLHIPEALIVFLLLLTIVPPNLAIMLRKPGHTDHSLDPVAKAGFLGHHPR